MSSFESVSFRFPCIVCGKPDWCFRVEDGKVLHCCRRISSDLEKTDRSGGDYWIHFENEEEGE